VHLTRANARGTESSQTRHWRELDSNYGFRARWGRAAAIYSLIETAKLNGLNPQHYLAPVQSFLP